jgi:hypothetical protein
MPVKTRKTAVLPFTCETTSSSVAEVRFYAKSLDVNLHSYHYAGNNPVKLVDPTGMADMITADTTREDIDNFNKNTISEDDEWSREQFWQETQDFFKENPNGAYYRAPGELMWQKFQNKEDANIIDPNKASLDLLVVAFGANRITRIIAPVKNAISLNFTKTAAGRLLNPSRMVPIQLLKFVVDNVKGVADPQGSSALMYYTQMLKNGRMYNLEVLYDKATNTVMHFLYTKDALGPFRAIK